MAISSDGPRRGISPWFFRFSQAIEARISWLTKVKRRNKLHGDLTSEIRELARSKPLVDIDQKSQALVAALVDTAQQDRTRLENALARIVKCGTIEPSTNNTVAEALRIERELGLSPQDATVYATVLAHLGKAGSGEKLFVNRNSNDFANPTIEDQLGKLECKLMTRFEAAAGYLKSTLKL